MDEYQLLAHLLMIGAEQHNGTWSRVAELLKGRKKGKGHPKKKAVLTSPSNKRPSGSPKGRKTTETTTMSPVMESKKVMKMALTEISKEIKKTTLHPEGTSATIGKTTAKSAKPTSKSIEQPETTKTKAEKKFAKEPKEISRRIIKGPNGSEKTVRATKSKKKLEFRRPEDNGKLNNRGLPPSHQLHLNYDEVCYLERWVH